MHPFANKRILLASKHEKERVIAPLFLEHVQAKVDVFSFDTDSLGTFTGEVPRLAPAYETCLQKARLAAEASEDGLGLGNEGSFGPHPHIPLIAAEHEIMVLVDLSKNRIISEQYLSTNTNYQHIVLKEDSSLIEFLSKVQFPSHAICIQDAKSLHVLAKGIQEKSVLVKLLKEGFKLYPELLVSSDMRAMMNPSRMKVIQALTEKFLLKLKNCCPTCQSPGFGLDGFEGALPCHDCQSATSFHAFEVWRCQVCYHSEHKPRSDGLLSAGPQYCYFCNP